MKKGKAEKNLRPIILHISRYGHEVDELDNEEPATSHTPHKQKSREVDEEEIRISRYSRASDQACTTYAEIKVTSFN